jgi:hypothetical protein
VIRWPDHDRSLESSYFDELLENTLESLPEAAREQGRTALESMPLPDSLPTLGDILLGPDGRIWVGEQPPLETFDPEAPSPPHRWFVLGSDGEVEARLTMPRGVRPVRVDGQRLLVIHRGEDVVETVRAYALPVETARSTGG